MRSQAIKQIILIALAIVIVVAVIKPELANVRNDQASMEASREALASIGIYNQSLQTLLDQSSSIPAADLRALDRYLPNKVDKTAVARDITTIAENNGLLVLEVTAEDPEFATIVQAPVGTGESFSGVRQDGPEDPSDSSVVIIDGEEVLSGGLLAHQFVTQVIGQYEDVKNMLVDLERNDYPLRLVQFEFSVEDETNLIQYSMIIETYSLDPN